MRFSAIVALGVAATAQANVVNSISKDVTSIATEIKSAAFAGVSSLASDISQFTHDYGTLLPTDSAERSSYLSAAQSVVSEASAFQATATGSIGTEVASVYSSAQKSLSALEASWHITPGNAQATPTPSSSTSSDASGNFAAATAVPVALGGVMGMAALLL